MLCRVIGHSHALYVLMKGKCVFLCMHLCTAFLSEKKVCCFWKWTPFLHHFLLHAHTHICTRIRVISSVLEGRGEREAPHWSGYSSWVMGSSCDGLSSVVTEQRHTEDGQWFYIKGDFSLKQRRADASSAVSYISSAPTKYSTETKQRYRELLTRRRALW